MIAIEDRFDVKRPTMISTVRRSLAISIPLTLHAKQNAIGGAKPVPWNLPEAEPNFYPPAAAQLEPRSVRLHRARRHASFNRTPIRVPATLTV